MAKTEITKGPTDPLLVDAEGHSDCILGNEAIVRGALEAGVGFACGYPGTPSSEITDSFARIAESIALPFEYSINEKLALEMAFAAALAGTRSICAMKHLGLMVAGDPLSTIPYMGVPAGMVIVSAGDPSCHTSPNEQDQRHLGPMLHIPILDPSTPTEALEMTRFAFELSEKSELPVLLRTTTRVAHSRSVVPFGRLGERKQGKVRRDPTHNVPIPAHARKLRLEIDQRMHRAAQLIGDTNCLRCDGSAPDVVLATGAPAATCADLLAGFDLSARPSLWSLSAPHPLPEAQLLARLREAKRVLVVEELSPFLENAVLSLVARHRLPVEVMGKLSQHLPTPFEYTPAIIAEGLAKAFDLKTENASTAEAIPLATRPPSLCPGCPHRAAFFAARSALDNEQLYFNDIGCYSLGFAPPLNAGDALLCMGAGYSLAAGVARVTGKRTVGFMGDSTFFHAGMPALLNAIKEEANIIAVVLDNQVTAMTGFQESAAGRPDNPASIKQVAEALGAKHVEVVDPYDLEQTTAAFRRAHAQSGVSVVLIQRACPVYQARQGDRSDPRTFVVDADRCGHCGREGNRLRCEQCITPGFERQLGKAQSCRRGTLPAPIAKEAPCSTQCPLGLCIQGYAGHIAAGEYAEALGHITARTMLPHSVCRVCDRPCEQGCIRSAIDAPVAINDLKRFCVDWAEEHAPQLLAPKRGKENGHRGRGRGCRPRWPQRRRVPR